MAKENDVAAIYANRIHISLNPIGLRVTFGEIYTSPNDEKSRVAVFLPMSVAKELGEMLTTVLNKAAEEHKQSH